MAEETGSLTVHMFPCLQDNYGFLVHDPDSGQTASIDTPDADAITRELEARHWQLTHILNTHHHWDHAGGNLALKQKYNCIIVGAEKDAHRIPGIDVRVQEGDIYRLGNHEFHVQETPGHTNGHIVYHVPEQHILFAGDTIFSVGCGRLFEGTPEQMLRSLEKIKRLPENTRIYCAHEYTLKNIQFARTIDQANPDLEEYYDEVRARRNDKLPTIPVTLARELKVNPFLRPTDHGIMKNLSAANDKLAAFTEIRKRKDQF
ncbi:MAG: hydroxyacylglutathione hydrolase [Gammaproteobacteria bacterium]|nr:hydroxyacylglutathione hydrolase [Gammaproteobacteria bacterium]